MTRVLPLALLPLLLLGGCADSHEDVYEDYIRTLQDISWMLADINNVAQWQRARYERDGLRGKLEGLRTRSKKLGEPAPETLQRLRDEHGEDVRRLLSELEAHRTRLEFKDFGDEAKAWIDGLPSIL